MLTCRLDNDTDCQLHFVFLAFEAWPPKKATINKTQSNFVRLPPYSTHQRTKPAPLQHSLLYNHVMFCNALHNQPPDTTSMIHLTGISKAIDSSLECMSYTGSYVQLQCTRLDRRARLDDRLGWTLECHPPYQSCTVLDTEIDREPNEP